MASIFCRSRTSMLHNKAQPIAQINVLLDPWNLRAIDAVCSDPESRLPKIVRQPRGQVRLLIDRSISMCLIPITIRNLRGVDQNARRPRGQQSIVWIIQSRQLASGSLAKAFIPLDPTFAFLPPPFIRLIDIYLAG